MSQMEREKLIKELAEIFWDTEKKRKNEIIARIIEIDFEEERATNA